MITNVCDYSPYDHPCSAVQRYLEDSTNGHDCGAQQDCSFPPEPLASVERSAGTEETANIVDDSHSTQKRGVLRSGETQKVEEIVGNNDAAEDAFDHIQTKS